jgi:hypothetical protein
MSKPWGTTKNRANTDRSTSLEMSEWLVEMLRRGAEAAASEPPTELKDRAAELYAQLQSMEEA